MMRLSRFVGVLVLIPLALIACDFEVKQSSVLPIANQDEPKTKVGQQVPEVSMESLVEVENLTALFEHVIERARSLSKAPYESQKNLLSTDLSLLDYDQYRSIRFRPEAAFWRDETPFELELFHLGGLYETPVQINLVHDKKIVTLPFDKRLFNYDGRAGIVSDLVSPELGYAGFRVHYPLNDASTKDEVVVFLGASYFRLLGRGHVYGLSSRGLAVDIAMSRDEEFPDFREFWLVRPALESTTMTFFALLDSPSITGAYRFDLSPGIHTTLAVDAHLYARREIAKLGVAPMSSMFLYGQDTIPTIDDFRPQVHDSDGLLIHTATDDWIWSPLNNVPGVQVTSPTKQTPRGFGLLQRNRKFDSYLDLEANYHRRPSEWVVLEDGDWGSGRVELLSFYTLSEFTDNVAAYWVPDQPMLAGDERQYRYQLVTFDSQLDSQRVAWVERTRIGWDTLPGQFDPPPRSHRRFIVDFRNRDVTAAESNQFVEAVIETSTGKISDLIVLSLPDRQGWRATFRFVPDGRLSADMRLYLKANGQRLSETWNYLWYSDRVQ